jgi:AcrR family transcriptional regulator
MKNKLTDRRIQRTRQLLQDALVELILEKGYEAITVQDIIDRANVGRSTFYAHFLDKDDLFMSGFESLREQFDQYLNSETPDLTDPWTLSLIIFKHIQNNQHLFKALIGRQGSPMMQAHFNKYLAGLLQRHIKSQLPEKAKQKVPPEILSLYVVNSLMAFLIWWLNNDAFYSAEQINDMYQTLTRPGVESLFLTK